MSTPYGRTFLQDEQGAVTVDWVVLTAAIVGLGLATMTAVSGGVGGLSGEIATELAEMDVVDSPFAGASAGSNWGSNPLLNTSGVTAERYASWTSGYSDAELVEVYEAYHNGAHPTMLDPGDRVDSIGALEADMISRGVDIPSGNPSYNDMYDAYTG
ncbi:hypothetical protein E2K80_11095 [Rhodophyticola sp. CCM32]|uniref:hypothetical protein n=1 Tax=Rhodophyticola sp. CCM32 TaxID=2916397 RepID=UPI00107F3006|nr:hypothetical protein [Rhodophyticola sp. CCM32]QBY01205.1 hypothetical protein E2K80_11095 [Rhodophyticola sp. CCM32]